MTDRTAVLVKFPTDLLALIDEEAAMRKISRTAVILDRCSKYAMAPSATGAVDGVHIDLVRPGWKLRQEGVDVIIGKTGALLPLGPAPSPPGSRLKQPKVKR